MEHSADVAYASEHGEFESFILDFEEAFHAVPAHPAEDRFNCCLLEAGWPLRRTRAPLHPDEPLEGTFLVWRVLGFGGKAFPLLYARVA